MSKIDLNNVAGGFNLSKINDNFQKIETALNDGALWRDNQDGEPNQMKNDLDINGHRIYNLPAPIAENEPARYKEIKDVQVVINQAHLDAQRAKDEADRAKYEADRATAAAGSSDASNLKVFSTKADADFAAATLPEGQEVEVSIDETRAGARTRYKVQAGALVLAYPAPAEQTSMTAIPIACSDETTALTVGTAKVTFRMPFAMTLSAVRASLTSEQASGELLTVNIKANGATILSTKITLDNTEKSSVTAAAQPVIATSALPDDAEITVDIDEVGDGTAKGLKVYLIGLPV